MASGIKLGVERFKADMTRLSHTGLNQYFEPWDEQLFINFKKCCFLIKKVPFLGYEVSSVDIQIDQFTSYAQLAYTHHDMLGLKYPSLGIFTCLYRQVFMT